MVLNDRSTFSIHTIISSNVILEVVLCYIVICTGYVYVPVEVRNSTFVRVLDFNLLHFLKEEP